CDEKEDAPMIKSVLCILTLAAFVFSVPGQRRSRNSPSVKSKKAAKPIQPSPVDPFSIPPPPPASKPTPDAEEEVVRVETNLVTTPVSVLDRNGRFIPGLRKKDFKIFENGVPQAITYFQSSEQPFTVVLMIDTSPSTRYHIDEIHYAAVTFVNQLRPTDQVMVMSFDSRLRILSEPTIEKQKIFAAIYKAQFGSGTSLYDSIDYVTGLGLVKALGRKAVVIFTDGVDTTSRQASFESTVLAVEEVDALFYPIRYNTQRQSGAAAAAQVYGMQFPASIMVPLGRGQSDAEYQKGKTYLEMLATNTGGRMFEADTIPNLEVAFAGVAEELRRQYSIGYYASDDGKPGDRKKIKIQVVRPPQAVVRAKSNYVVKQKPDEISGQPSNTSSDSAR
ncbi:MAG: VWA domain-containing protein, partial [Acidobacteriota bacterium]